VDGCRLSRRCCLGAAETYTPLLSKTGRLPAEHVDHGLAEQCRGHEEGTFFAAGNDDTYVAGECEGRAGALAQLPAGVQEGLAMRPTIAQIRMVSFKNFGHQKCR
jgi:hypothetical protein